ncbi:MAG: dephospho-CoA kinase [Candidatus Omnitrophica bacterium]|nr:dephospho-CoA kinase [Candidatus Omnitrophota bacterium]MDD5724690.1 dephospho-CoA kinase [Candidatus Omnitrophota bacterium]
MPKPRKNKFILGVTGNIACGKSTVARMFKTGDCLLIDADKLSRRLIARGGPVYRKIKKLFGEKVLKRGGFIDRKKLGEIVFSDRDALKKLNRLMHPEIIRLIRESIDRSKKKLIILDAALIVEAGLSGLMDKLVVVRAGKSQQVRRAQKSLGLNKKEVSLRMESQISQNKKSRFADFIIDNSKSLAKTKKQVSLIRRQLWKS